MKWILYILTITLVVILEGSVFRVFNFGSFTPDLILLLTLAAVWSGSNYDFSFFSVLGGFWLETILALPVGSIIIGTMMIGSVAYLILQRWFFSEKPWQYFFAAVIAGSVVMHLWLWLYTQVLHTFHWAVLSVGFGHTWRNLIPSIVVNLFLIYPIYALLEWVASLTQTFNKNRVKL